MLSEAKNNTMLREFAADFRSGRDIAAGRSGELFNALISSTDESVIGELLAAWNTKGISEDELFSFAQIMRERMTKVRSRHETFADAVGTGGSKVKTFNVSTAAAFVIAGAGMPVAKHGNRAATSSSGSADVLSMLGVDPNGSPETAERCLNEIDICFMFAPTFHSLSTVLASARRAMRQPTIFNNLGPLCNPASAPHQIIGVWDIAVLEKTARVLARLGTKRSWVVHSRSGLDEIDISDKTYVAEIEGTVVTTFEIAPADFGLEVTNPVLKPSHSAADSAAVISQILNNWVPGSDAENLVLVNAAAAIHIAGRADTLPQAFEIAKESIQSGAAKQKLEKLVEATTK